MKRALEGGRSALRPPLAALALDELAAFLRLAGRAGALQPALLPLLTFVCQCAAHLPRCPGRSARRAGRRGFARPGCPSSLQAGQPHAAATLHPGSPDRRAHASVKLNYE